MMNQIFEDLLRDFEEDCRLRKFTTIKVYRNTVKRFLKFLEDNGYDPIDVGRTALKKYLVYLRENRHLQFSSLEKEFSCISALYDFLEDEGKIASNPITGFRKRYLRQYKAEVPAKRKFLSVEEVAMLVRTTLDTRDRAIILLLFKTGIRRGELASLDISDVDLPELTITLKPTPKRSNRIIFIDHETAEALRRWLETRKHRKGAESPALFLSFLGGRLSGDGIANLIKKHATRCGLHDPGSAKLEDRLGPHCGRVWCSAWLERSGMRREDIQELRGDAHREAIDIYLRKDMKKLKESYLAHIPQLGI